MISQRSFGILADGRQATLWTLQHPGGMSASICDYGGIIVSLLVPDANGQLGDVVLGFDSVQGYEAHSPYFGCITGRVANRIAHGAFELDGVQYKLPINNGPNCLHGGIKGFDKVLWAAEPLEATAVTDGLVGLRLTYVSADMEEGFPGALSAQVTYTLSEDNTLRVDYAATTDKPTLINLCNHSYFNLEPGSDSCLGQSLQIYASHYTPIDADSIPLGTLDPVAGTPFDFQTPKSIGSEIEASNLQLQRGHGYDHNLCLTKTTPGALELAAVAQSPVTGRVLKVSTTEPGVQLYTGNFLSGSFSGKGGIPVLRRSGFCLETQHYPDAVHHPEWPTTILRPGDHFRSTTAFQFGVLAATP